MCTLAEGERNDKYVDGNKFHLTVHPKYLSAAFDHISPWLFSDDNPFGIWKVTDQEVVINHLERTGVDTESLSALERKPQTDPERFYCGVQFTFYCTPDRIEADDSGEKTSVYQVSAIKRMSLFLQELERVLSEKGIPAGIVPDSDILVPKGRYISYRKEGISQRLGGNNEWKALMSEPMYRLITTVSE
ncbi:MAPK phosphothreonine lyase [invertebrate metagenome]|uniref:MAPK phosphothreonine lyase n=1 Tax=invertebrate metagenome TaxID=1711999 RepID=A0A2H9T3Y7_9ZZZZ